MQEEIARAAAATTTKREITGRMGVREEGWEYRESIAITEAYEVAISTVATEVFEVTEVEVTILGKD